MTTNIEWTDATWNPTSGCTKVSPGCLNCYIERTPPMRIAGRKFEHGKIPMQLHPDRLELPLKRKKPTMFFVNSMSDLFHEDVPDDYICDVFKVMGRAKQHTFQVLTKRATRMQKFMREQTNMHAIRMLDEPGFHVHWPYPNVWLGVSVENRLHGLPRIELLRQTPAAIRFLSVEPLIDDVGQLDLTGIGWVIVGGESGPDARPTDPRWVRTLRDQCVEFGVPFFFKQWGEWVPLDQVPGLFERRASPEIGPLLRWPFKENEQQYGPGMVRLGKKKAGRLLDGRLWDEMPKVSVPAQVFP